MLKFLDNDHADDARATVKPAHPPLIKGDLTLNFTISYCNYSKKNAFENIVGYRENAG